MGNWHRNVTPNVVERLPMVETEYTRSSRASHYIWYRKNAKVKFFVDFLKTDKELLAL